MSCNRTRTPTIPVSRKIRTKMSRAGLVKVNPDKINQGSQVNRARINLVNPDSPDKPNLAKVSRFDKLKIKEKIMDKDRVKGAAHEAKGGIKETAGRVTGNKDTELEGKAEKNAGTVQHKTGELNDAVRDAKHNK